MNLYWEANSWLISSTFLFLIHNLKYKLSCCEILEKDGFKASFCRMRTLDLGLRSQAVKAQSGSAVKVEELEQTATFQKLKFDVKKRSFLNRSQPPFKHQKLLFIMPPHT